MSESDIEGGLTRRGRPTSKKPATAAASTRSGLRPQSKAKTHRRFNSVASSNDDEDELSTAQPSMTIPATSQYDDNGKGKGKGPALSQEDTPYLSVENPRSTSPFKLFANRAAAGAKNALGATMSTLQQKSAASGPNTRNLFNRDSAEAENLNPPEAVVTPATVRPPRKDKAPIHGPVAPTPPAQDYNPTEQEVLAEDGVLSLATTFPGFSTDPGLTASFNEEMITFGTPAELLARLQERPNLVFYGIKFLIDEFIDLAERRSAEVELANVNNASLTKLESDHRIQKSQLKTMTRKWETADELGKAIQTEVLDLRQKAAEHQEVEDAMKKDLDVAEGMISRRDGRIGSLCTALQQAQEENVRSCVTVTPTPSYVSRFNKSPDRRGDGGEDMPPPPPPQDTRGYTPGSAIASTLSSHPPKSVCRDPFKFGGKDKDKSKFEEWLYAMKNKLRVDKAYLDYFYPGDNIVDFIVTCTEDIAWRRMQQHLKGKPGVTAPFLTAEQALGYLEKQYGPQNTYRIHAHEFAKLKMGNMSFEDFYAKFEEHALPQNLPDMALIEAFRDKLSPRYLNKIVHEEYDNLQDAVDACRRFKIGFEKMDDIRGKDRNSKATNSSSPVTGSGRKSFYRTRSKPANASEIEGEEDDNPGTFPEWAKKLPRLTSELRRENRRRGLCDACRKPNHIATSPDCELYRFSSRLNEVQIDDDEEGHQDDLSDEEFEDYYDQGNA